MFSLTVCCAFIRVTVGQVVLFSHPRYPEGPAADGGVSVSGRGREVPGSSRETADHLPEWSLSSTAGYAAHTHTHTCRDAHNIYHIIDQLQFNYTWICHWMYYSCIFNSPSKLSSWTMLPWPPKIKQWKGWALHHPSAFLKTEPPNQRPPQNNHRESYHPDLMHHFGVSLLSKPLLQGLAQFQSRLYLGSNAS